MAKSLGTRVRAFSPRLVAAAALALVAGVPVATRSASAALLVHEPFDYAAGAAITDTPATGLNLAGAYTSNAPNSFLELRVESPGLDYGNLAGAPPAAGNRLSQNSGGGTGVASVDVDQDVIVGPGSAVYFSTLFRFSDAANGNHRAHVALVDADTSDTISFGEAVVGIRALRVEAATAATGGELVADGADGAFTNGQTLLLIGRYTNAAAPGSDTLELVGYDTADAVALPGAFDPLDPNAQFSFALEPRDIDLARISRIDFTIRGAANNFIDELRIGSTYAAIVPEPAAAVPLLAFAAAVGFARRTAWRGQGNPPRQGRTSAPFGSHQ